jgi:hypothetical protein
MSYALIKNVSALPKPEGGGRPKLSIPYLSPSQVASFSRCEAAYYAQYAKGRSEPGKPVLMLGTGTHRFAEAYHELMSGGRPENEWFDGAMHAAHATVDADLKADPQFNWDEPVWYSSNTYSHGMAIEFDIRGTPIDHELTKSDLLKWRLEQAATLLAPSLKNYDPIRLEQGYLITWADNTTLPILGFADLVAHAKTDPADRKRIIDYKTSGRAKGPTDVLRNIGLTAYSIGEGLTFGSQMIEDVAFINVITTKEMKVATIEGTRIEDDIRRLYNAARVQTLKLRAGLIGISDNPQYCTDCYHRDWCEDAFGGRRNVLDELEMQSPQTLRQAATDAHQLQIVA